MTMNLVFQLPADPRRGLTHNWEPISRELMSSCRLDDGSTFLELLIYTYADVDWSANYSTCGSAELIQATPRWSHPFSNTPNGGIPNAIRINSIALQFHFHDRCWRNGCVVLRIA